jgi:acetyltransferase-like isoleucine patch superfamily enzyme
MKNNEISQLRRNLRFTSTYKLRWFINKQKLGKLGKKVFIDKNVEFLRFPGNISIDDHAIIKEGAKICPCNDRARIFIGERTTIGYHTFIFASEKITIGNDCLIAPFVYIVDSNHQIKKELLINQQPNETAEIIIEDDVWIASNVTILKGVNIGKGAVIAANSVVNKSVPSYEIWGGTPAKKIGQRD